MVAWRSAFLICLAFSLDTLVQRGSADFDLSDALKETSSVKYERNLSNDLLQANNAAGLEPRDSGFTLRTFCSAVCCHWKCLHRQDNDDPKGFSDKDLEDVLGGGDYKPDKGRGDGRYGNNDDSEAGMSPETGTIAGVASTLAMALIGAITSYISYQQKKFCFRIQHAAEGQEGLNADHVKGENLEAVVCEEPQVKCLELPPQSAEPPQPQPPRI